MADCFRQISKLGNVGKLYGKVENTLTINNLLDGIGGYTFKSIILLKYL